MQLTRRYRVRGALLALSLTWLTLACTVTTPPDANEATLVKPDAEVFDQRFRELNPEDLALDRFWTEARPMVTDEEITVHHLTLARLANRVSDGVVNLYTKMLSTKEARIGIDPNEILPFRIPIVSRILDFVPFQVPIPFRTEGFSLGSAFLINEQGYLLTNAHVVHNATDIHVVRSGSRQELQAKIIGIDPLTDTALLRMDPQLGMTVLPLADSDALQVGEMVVALGNPFGLTHSVTFGVISAKERIAAIGDSPYLDFLQTDSAINPGSSGGPLLNLRGEVVGINTAIVANAQSVGFAIPINTVKTVMPLLVLGQTDRGWFGATARILEPGEAARVGYPFPDAVLIADVVPDSPADQAGLQVGDVVVRINETEVKDFVTFRRQLTGVVPGDTLTLTISRDGEEIVLHGTAVERPED